MSEDSRFKPLVDLVDKASTIVIIQADNPDVDSLASALALESILEQLGKTVILYCGVELPSYMHYIPGWDRVIDVLPKQFDASIIVDTSSDGLLSQLDKRGEKAWLAAKPSVAIDHHATDASLTISEIISDPKAVSTTEIIYEIAKHLDWELDKSAMDMIAIGILSDSLGLMAGSTTSKTIRIIAELVDKGVKLAELDNARRETMRKEPELIAYKGKLLQRVEFVDNGRIALLVIPWDEIEKYSPLYNPPMLVIDDMRLGKNTDLAVCFKTYNDGKVTAKLRANYGKGIADKLAEHFGGGGHPYAAGFKITDGRSLDEIRQETIEVASKLLDDREKELHAEAV